MKLQILRMVKLIFLIISIMFVIGVPNLNNTVYAQRGRCGNQTLCVDTNIFVRCVPLLTTLPAVSSTSNGYGFQPASSNCGAYRCYILLACKCGPALGAGVCNTGLNGVSSCDVKVKKNKGENKLATNAK